MNKERSGGKLKVTITENIQAIHEALKVNNGHLSAGKNGHGISESSFCRIKRNTLASL